MTCKLTNLEEQQDIQHRTPNQIGGGSGKEEKNPTRAKKRKNREYVPEKDDLTLGRQEPEHLQEILATQIERQAQAQSSSLPSSAFWICCYIKDVRSGYLQKNVFDVWTLDRNLYWHLSYETHRNKDQKTFWLVGCLTKPSYLSLWQALRLDPEWNIINLDRIERIPALIQVRVTDTTHFPPTEVDKDLMEVVRE